MSCLSPRWKLQALAKLTGDGENTWETGRIFRGNPLKTQQRWLLKRFGWNLSNLFFEGPKKAVAGSEFFKLRGLALNKLEPFSVTVHEN